MKRHYLLIVAGALLLITGTASAQQKKRTTSTAKKTTTASAPLTKVSAGKIIDMTNGVVDIYNDQIGEMKDIRDCIDRFEKSIETVAENPNRSTHAANGSGIRAMRNDLLEKFRAKAKLAPAFAEKAEIQSNIDMLEKEFVTVKERCNTVYDYFKNKKFTEDDKDFSNYVALRDTFIASYVKINDLFARTMKLSSAAGDRAELVILKTHPMANVIIPMKTNLSAVKNVMALCREEKPDAEAIKAEVAAIRKSLEKDKVMTAAMKTSLKKSHNGEDIFNRFYEYVGGAMDKTDNFLEYLDPNKKITDIDHVYKETEDDARNRHLKRHYGEINSYYGYMVHEYNNL